MTAIIALLAFRATDFEFNATAFRMTLPFEVTGSPTTGFAGVGDGLTIRTWAKGSASATAVADRIEKVAAQLKSGPEVKAFNGGSRLKFTNGAQSGGILRYNLTLTDGREIVVDYGVLRIDGALYEIDFRAERNNPAAMGALASGYASLKTASGPLITGFGADRRFWQDWESKRLMIGLRVPHTPWMTIGKPIDDELSRDTATYHDGTYDLRIVVSKLKPLARRSSQDSLDVAFEEFRRTHPGVPQELVRTAVSRTVDSYPGRQLSIHLPDREVLILAAIRNDTVWCLTFSTPSGTEFSSALEKFSSVIKLLKPG